MKSMVFSLGAAALFFAVSCWGAGWNFAVSGILSLLLYGALLLLTKPRKKIAGVDVELPTVMTMEPYQYFIYQQ